MKASKTAPHWAIDLVHQVCSDYKRKLPGLLQWYNVQRGSASGYTWFNGKKIHISACHDDTENKIVLLHELAHHIVSKTRKGKREGHSLRFWRLVFELSQRYGTGVDETYKREVESYVIKRYLNPSYRAKAVWAYEEIKKAPR